MLADLFQKLRNTCLEIWKLDPTKFLSALELVWQTALKKAKVKLDLLNDVNMLLLMVGKGIRGRIRHSELSICKS